MIATPGDVRLFLLHGADAAGSSALAQRLQATLGAGAERLALAPAVLKADPALLADEAASFSLFGGKRLIAVDGGGDELVEAVTGLLDASTAGNPVVIVTAALKKTSKLLALAEASPRALAYASYVPEGRDADRMVVDLGHSAGLSIPPGIAHTLAESGAGDRAVIGFEIDKFALYLDASPDRPTRLEREVVEALSAGAEEGDLTRVVDAVLDGQPDRLDRELKQLGGGTEAIAVLRALGRRLLLLARHRSEVERGNSVETVMASAGKSLFFRDKPAVERQLGHWSANRLAAALAHILDAERAVKAPASLGADAVNALLFRIAQTATRRR